MRQFSAGTRITDVIGERSIPFFWLPGRTRHVIDDETVAARRQSFIQSGASYAGLAAIERITSATTSVGCAATRAPRTIRPATALARANVRVSSNAQTWFAFAFVFSDVEEVRK